MSHWSAYQEGWIAGPNTKAKNPYPKDTIEHEDWSQGAREYCQEVKCERQRAKDRAQGIGSFLAGNFDLAEYAEQQ